MAASRELFSRWSAVLGVLHLALSTFVINETLKYPWKTPLEIVYSNWTQEDGSQCSETSPCYITEEKYIVNDGVNIGLLIPFFSLISGFHHIYTALWTDTYVDEIENLKGANPYRAFDYLFSSSLMIVVAAVLFKAPPDLGFLFTVAGVQAATILVGFCLEIIGRDPHNYCFWAVFTGIMIVYTFLWASLLMPFYFSVQGAPSVVILFILYLLESFLRFPIQFVLPELKVLWNKVFHKNRGIKTLNIKNLEAEILEAEFGWMALSAESKIPLLVLFYFGVVARSGSVLFGIPDEKKVKDFNAGPNDEELRIVFILTVIASLLCEILIRYAPDLKNKNGHFSYAWIFVLLAIVGMWGGVIYFFVKSD